MAYKIQYNPEDNARYPTQKKAKSIYWKPLLFVLGVLTTVLWLRHKGLPNFLIPGDPDITIAAAKNMILNLQEGTSVNKAFTVFCRDIIHGAGF